MVYAVLLLGIISVIWIFKAIIKGIRFFFEHPIKVTNILWYIGICTIGISVWILIMIGKETIQFLKNPIRYINELRKPSTHVRHHNSEPKFYLD